MKFLFVVLGLLSCVSAANAQQLAPGSRVRVTLLAYPEAPIAGNLIAYRPDSLSLAADPDSMHRAYALSGIARLERSMGVHNRAGRGAVIGAVVGGVTAGLLGALFASSIKEGDTGAIPYVLAAGGVLGGGLIGAAIGEGSRHETWEQVQP